MLWHVSSTHSFNIWNHQATSLRSFLLTSALPSIQFNATRWPQNFITSKTLYSSWLHNFSATDRRLSSHHHQHRSPSRLCPQSLPLHPLHKWLHQPFTHHHILKILWWHCHTCLLNNNNSVTACPNTISHFTYYVKLPFLYCLYINLHLGHQKCTLATKFRGLVAPLLQNISIYSCRSSMMWTPRNLKLVVGGGSQRGGCGCGVAYPHSLGSAHQEVQYPITDGSIEP